MGMVDQAVRAGQTGLEALVGMAEEDMADLRVGTRGKVVGKKFFDGRNKLFDEKAKPRIKTFNA